MNLSACRVALFTAICLVLSVSADDFGEALQHRIDVTAASGGGCVVVPAGRHLIGQINLRSHVELHLEEGAVLEGQTGLEHYQVTELPYSEGAWSAIVSAIGCTNVAITGKGEIYGNGTAWPQPENYGGNQEGLRPRGIFFADCKGVRLRDFTLRDAACWGVVFKCCEDVDVRRLTIDTHANANNDGIDVEARNVVVADCDIDAGDDGVCIKSNTPDFVVENILVTNVTARSHCNALKLGTASHGTMRNVLFVDCRTEPPRRDFIDRRCGRNRRWYEEDPVRVGHYPGGVLGEAAGNSAIAIENVDGGIVENIVYRNIMVYGSRAPIFVRAGTRAGRSCGTPPSDKYVFRNITIENVTGEAMSAVASSVTGVPGCRIANVTLRNVNIVTRGGGENEDERTRPVPEVAGKYPDAHMFGCMLPAYGLYGRHVDGLKLENVSFTLTPGMSDCREMMVFDDVIRMPVAYWRFDEGDANPVRVEKDARIVSEDGRGACLRLDSSRARARAKVVDAVTDISSTERPYTAMIRIRPDADVVSDTMASMAKMCNSRRMTKFVEAMRDGQWHHVALVFDPTQCGKEYTVYFDWDDSKSPRRFTSVYPKDSGSKLTLPLVIKNSKVMFGGPISWGFYSLDYKGLIDDVVLFSTPLASEEIATAVK